MSNENEPLENWTTDHLNRFAKQIMEQRLRETDTLVAKFIVDNPGVKAEEIELVEQETFGDRGRKWFVRRRDAN